MNFSEKGNDVDQFDDGDGCFQISLHEIGVLGLTDGQFSYYRNRWATCEYEETSTRPICIGSMSHENCLFTSSSDLLLCSILLLWFATASSFMRW